MRITLTMQQQTGLLAWATEIARAHAETESEPPGYVLEISVGPMQARACARSGTATHVIGEVELELSCDGQPGATGEEG